MLPNIESTRSQKVTCKSKTNECDTTFLCLRILSWGSTTRGTDLKLSLGKGRGPAYSQHPWLLHAGVDMYLVIIQYQYRWYAHKVHKSKLANLVTAEERISCLIIPALFWRSQTKWRVKDDIQEEIWPKAIKSQPQDENILLTASQISLHQLIYFFGWSTAGCSLPYFVEISYPAKTLR